MPWSPTPVTIVSNEIFNVSGNSVASPSFNLVAGNQVFVSIFWYDLTFAVSTITDTAGNTYVLVDTVQNVNIGGILVYYCTNAIANSSNVVTVTWAGANFYRYIIVDQRSGGLTSGALDTHTAKETGSGGVATPSVTSNSFTATTAGELIYVAACVNSQGNTFTAGSGYTLVLTAPTNKQLTTEMQINSGVTTASITNATTSSEWGIITGTFKPAPTVATIQGVLSIQGITSITL